MELENSRATQEPSRIVIADDHPLFRCAIRHTLESHSDFEVVGEAANGREALEFCRRAQGPDLRSLYISRTGIKLRSGACAAPREHANRGWQEFTGRFIMRGTACLTWVCILAA
jgi:AmiR/NasT family two-component response regulator